MSIPQHFIDELVARVDVVDIIDAYVPLKKAGRDYRALCPFHSEKTPSFSVSQEKQFYHCFGCGANGTAIGFLMEYLNLEFRDAVEELANRVNIPIPEEGGHFDKSASRTAELYELMNMVADMYRNNLRDHEQAGRAVDYLKNRGISGKIAAEYELGYAAPGWDNIIESLGNSSTALERLSKIGMVLRNDSGNYYDRFRDRLIFPIRDQRGRAIGLGGRILDGATSSTPKYLNSPTTPIFHKDRELYGLYQAKKAIKDRNSLYIVEGYMDVIALAQFGIPNVASTMGTAVTRGHIEKVFRISNKIIFCFDGDAAGKNAAHKAMQTALPLLYEGRQIFFRFIPQGDDPDSYIRRHGKEQFDIREELTPLSDYLLSLIQQGLSLAVREDRDKLVHRATGYMRQMPQSGLKQLLTEKISLLTGLDTHQIESRCQDNKKVNIKSRRPYAGSAPLNPMAIAISFLLRKPDLVSTINVESELEQIEVDGHEFLRDVIGFIREHPETSAAGIIEHWRGTKYERRLAELTPIDSPYGGEDEALYSDENMRLTFIDAIGRMKVITRKQKLRKLVDINSVSELTDEHRRLLPGLSDKNN